jgi:NAD(P)-dependent dehydrogenase (short-subunit alcohol dehydrogenase family)
VRTVVVGASSGLGRCIGIGLARLGDRTALLARRLDRLEAAAEEAGPGTIALRCDVTNRESCQSAISDAAKALGGIDALVYTPAIGPLMPLTETDAETWHKVLGTNVIGAALVTAAAVPHLTEASGTAVYLSSVSASVTAPWPGLGAYSVSKAALDKLVEAWRVEHPTIGFTRLVVGDCVGGDGDSATGFANEWEPQLAKEMLGQWVSGNYLSGAFVGVDDLIGIVHSLLHFGASVAMPSLTVVPRLGQ